MCERTVLADRPLARMRGLLGRRELPAGEGLLLTPAPAIHTAFMRFEIDALFLDRDLRVVRIVERLKPWRAAHARRAHSVLELSAGEAVRAGVQIEDQLQLVEESPADTSVHGRDEMPQPEPVDEHQPEQAPGHSGPSPAEAGGPGGRREPSMRVMVLSADRRFREIASLLLMRRGCSVAVGENSRALAERLERDRTEVVVIDAERSLAAAARMATAIDALSHPVGIVVVNDQAEADLTSFHAVPKWGSFDELFAAITEACARRGRQRGLAEQKRNGESP